MEDSIEVGDYSFLNRVVICFYLCPDTTERKEKEKRKDKVLN